MLNKRARQSLERIKYCAENNMLGADFELRGNGVYCAIGCLFTDDALDLLNDRGEDAGLATCLYSRYPKLESDFGMSKHAARHIQRKHDSLVTSKHDVRAFIQEINALLSGEKELPQ